MQKLPLEELLEKGLGLLDIEFKQRVYHEDFLVMAEVDDAMESESVESYEKDLHSKDPLQAMLSTVFCSLTKVQRDVHAGTVPFFERSSGCFNSIFLEYRVYSTQDLEKYEPCADRLIEEGRISNEYVTLYTGEDDPFYLLMINTYDYSTCPMIDVDIDSGLIEKHFPGQDPHKGLEKLAATSYNEDKVYDAVMRFVLGLCRKS